MPACLQLSGALLIGAALWQLHVEAGDLTDEGSRQPPGALQGRGRPNLTLRS